MEFGQIKKVELRDIWKNEALDFTPWLIGNLDKLGELIGIELESVTREASVGSFFLDILAKDINRDRTVIIENQLEQTDHKHLGQLITYASFYEAEVIIWVSQSVQEEHRSAIDWLNNNTDDKLEFYAVEVEVIKIDNSKPALNFKLKAVPNEWRKSKGGREIGESSTMSAYREFFHGLIGELRDKYKFTNARQGQPQSWYSFATGTKGTIFGASFARGNKVRVDLYIDTGNAEVNKQIYSNIYKDKEKIENLFNETLDWEELPDKRASRVALYREGNINDDTQSLMETKKWFVEKLLLMKKVFAKELPNYMKIKVDEISHID